jgi:hypothetical protein
MDLRLNPDDIVRDTVQRCRSVDREMTRNLGIYSLKKLMIKSLILMMMMT